MNFDFELILFYAVLLTGFIALIDILFFAKKRKKAGKVKLPLLIDYSRSFFPILLIVFLLRSFLIDPFRIPSGSLEPTLFPGDLILVNKYQYGIRLPIVHKKIYSIHEPKRGDIVVFRWPPNPSFYFIKRIIGVPGDKISYINKKLYINGQEIPQTFVKNAIDQDEAGKTWDVQQKEENLLGVSHAIYETIAKSTDDFHDVEVPKGMYFAMGDNRDDSADSRYWGFVPEQNIVGHALLIWFSWDSNEHTIRWNRIGRVIH